MVVGLVCCFCRPSTTHSLTSLPWTESLESSDPDLSPKDGSPRWILPPTYTYPFPRTGRAENFIRFGRRDSDFMNPFFPISALTPNSPFPSKANKKNNFIRLGRENPRPNNFIRLGRSHSSGTGTGTTTGQAETWQWKEEPESREDYPIPSN